MMIQSSVDKLMAFFATLTQKSANKIIGLVSQGNLGGSYKK